jgi:hypothetical protein
MTTMASHVSATAREETPHVNDALRRHAQSLLNNRSINPQWRPIIRYALEIDDPCLADLVRRADAGETIIDATDFSQSVEVDSDSSIEAKVQTLAEIICRAGDEPAAALFVLMGTLEHSPQPKLLANTAKHLAFTRCSESNLYGIVDAQLSFVEGELLANEHI